MTSQNVGTAVSLYQSSLGQRDLEQAEIDAANDEAGPKTSSNGRQAYMQISLDEIKAIMKDRLLGVEMDDEDDELMIALEKAFENKVITFGDVYDKRLSDIFSGVEISSLQKHRFSQALSEFGINIPD